MSHPEWCIKWDCVGMCWRFSPFKPPYHRKGARQDQGCDQSLIGNRIACAFYWCPKSVTLVDLQLTLNSHYCCYITHTFIDRSPPQKSEWRWGPHYQRQECSPWIILVSSKIRFVQIFAGVRRRRYVREWGRRKWRFSLHSLAMSSKLSHATVIILWLCTGNETYDPELLVH